MSDLVLYLAIGVVVAVFIGIPAAAIGVTVARMQGRGTRFRWRRPCAAEVLVLDLLGLLPPASAPATWAAIRAGMSRPPRYVDTSRALAEMCGPIVTDDEVAEEWSLRPLSREGIREQWDRASVPMSPDPEVRPGVGWQVPDDWRLPGGRGLMFARRTPWPSAADPMTPAETDDAPPWDIETAQQDAVPAYGVDRCELDVDAARRQFAGLALGPDGCEEVSRA
jgi:hypothetical protein